MGSFRRDYACVGRQNYHLFFVGHFCTKSAQKFRFFTGTLLSASFWRSGYVRVPRLRTVEKFNPTTKTWKEVAALFQPRLGHTAGVFSGKIYVIGGDSSLVEAYHPSKNNWEIIDNNITVSHSTKFTIFWVFLLNCTGHEQLRQKNLQSQCLPRWHATPLSFPAYMTENTTQCIFDHHQTIKLFSYFLKTLRMFAKKISLFFNKSLAWFCKEKKIVLRIWHCAKKSLRELMQKKIHITFGKKLFCLV